MRLAAALLSLTVFAMPAFAQDDVQDAARDKAAVANATDAAIKAAGTWLAVLDAGKYAQSWSDGAAALRAAVGQAIWEEGLRAVRAPAGAAGARTLTRSHYTRALPGAPAGEYVILQYSTDFAGKPGAIETVVPMREADGTWRVSGYYIK